MKEREPRLGEVSAVTSADGRMVFAIVKRPDGLFSYYQDYLGYDEEDDLWLWSQGDPPGDGLFGSPDEAEREIRANNRHLF